MAPNEIALGRVTALVQRGISPSYDEAGVVVLNQKCVRDHKIDFGPSRITNPEKRRISDERYLRQWDVLVNSTGVGTLGRVAQVRQAVSEPVTVDSHITIVRPDLTRLNGLFFGYAVEWREAQIEAMGAGATGQTELSRTRLAEDVSIPLLPIEIQERVGVVLAVYDDLIANNLRRIEILEQMARTIYREWFVEYRYPGHEGVRMVESELGPIPEGWQWTPMSEFAQVVDCSHARKPKEIADGPGLLLHVWNVGDGGKLNLDKQYRIDREDYEDWTKRMEVQEGDCVITKTGRVGAVAQVPPGVRAALGRNLVGMRRTDVPTFLLQYLLSSTKDAEVVRLTSRGTIMESLPVASVERLRIPVPPGDLLQTFETVARPYGQLVEVLAASASTLRKTRDLLLPKLVSGEVDVSDLDIDTGELLA